jgi:hypothetical protein
MLIVEVIAGHAWQHLSALGKFIHEEHFGAARRHLAPIIFSENAA